MRWKRARGKSNNCFICTRLCSLHTIFGKLTASVMNFSFIPIYLCISISQSSSNIHSLSLSLSSKLNGIGSHTYILVLWAIEAVIMTQIYTKLNACTIFIYFHLTSHFKCVSFILFYYTHCNCHRHCNLYHIFLCKAFVLWVASFLCVCVNKWLL